MSFFAEICTRIENNKKKGYEQDKNISDYSCGHESHGMGGNKTERKAELVAVETETVNPSGDDLKVNTRNRQTTITITSTKKKRRLFSSFVLTIDAKTSAILQLRMNERGSNYINYEFK